MTETPEQKEQEMLETILESAMQGWTPNTLLGSELCYEPPTLLPHDLGWLWLDINTILPTDDRGVMINATLRVSENEKRVSRRVQISHAEKLVPSTVLDSKAAFKSLCDVLLPSNKEGCKKTVWIGYDRGEPKRILPVITVGK